MRAPRSATAMDSLPLAGIASTTRADDHPMLDYLSITGGVFANNMATPMRVDGNVKNSGTNINLSRNPGQGGTRLLPYRF